MKQLSILTISAVTLLCSFSSCKDRSCIDEDAINPNGICIQIYAPVCGCDGVTYSNDCHAKNAGVKTWTKGECK